MTTYRKLGGALALAVAATFVPAHAGMDEAKRWVEKEFQPSTLTKEQQLKELEWFVNAAKPFKGLEIKVVSETIATHEYESKTLAKAFSEITGITVNHDLLQEGDVLETLQTQMQSNENVYDMYVNDTDSIGTHYRYGQAVPLTDFMAGEGKAVTLADPRSRGLHRALLRHRARRKLYQLPNQQFANLYWFRYDWFNREISSSASRTKYGYELGVPVELVGVRGHRRLLHQRRQGIDGVRVYGHMDYGKKDPSLGWRFTDAWLSMAGVGSPGIPNGLPIDEWGIRVEDCRPVGSSVSRGGDANSPAAVYALTKYIDWLKSTRRPMRRHDFSQAVPARDRARSHSRSSGTPHSPRPWSLPRAGSTPSTTTARRSGAWRLRRTGRTGKRA